MSDKMACPKCGSEEYKVIGHDENSDENYISRWCICRCDKCGYYYEIDKIYTLSHISVNGN